MIGIFDSGIGGLTVAKAITETLPGYDIIYLGDVARTPYGNKSPYVIRKYALENINFLMGRGAKIIVMACNSAASAFEPDGFPFEMPVFEVITPAAELAVKATKKGIIGVIGTRATIESKIYERKMKKIMPGVKIWSNPAPLLVPLVEEGWVKKPETNMIIKKYLRPLKVRMIDTLILGCTHYPVIKKTISRKAGKRVKVIDSGLAVAWRVKEFLKNNPGLDSRMKKEDKQEFFASDITPHFKALASYVMKKRIKLRHVDSVQNKI